MIRILFFIHSLSGGGAERVLIYLLKNLDRKIFQIGLAVMEKKGPFLHLVPDDVKIFDLQVVEKNPLYFPKILWQLRRIIREYKPKLIFSMLWYANIAAILATRNSPNIQTIISERILTSYEIGKETVFGPLRQVKRWLIRNIYPLAHHIIAVSKEISSELVIKFGIRPDQVTVIQNPVDISSIRRSGEMASDPWGEDGFRILAIGRLTHQKGFDVLIKAFAHLRTHIGANLTILGEGPERASLELLVKNEGLEGDISMPGFSDNPYAYLYHANLFVLPSRAEGFPNVLLEAMSLGIPVIATDCETGPREILKNGTVCPLVPVNDELALAETMYLVLNNPAYREELSKNCYERVQDFTISKQISAYQTLFENLAKG